MAEYMEFKWNKKICNSSSSRRPNPQGIIDIMIREGFFEAVFNDFQGIPQKNLLQRD